MICRSGKQNKKKTHQKNPVCVSFFLSLSLCKEDRVLDWALFSLLEFSSVPPPPLFEKPWLVCVLEIKPREQQLLLGLIAPNNNNNNNLCSTRLYDVSFMFIFSSRTLLGSLNWWKWSEMAHMDKCTRLDSWIISAIY